MPFIEVNINKVIQKEKDTNPEFAKAWNNSRKKCEVSAELKRQKKYLGQNGQDVNKI